MMPEWKIDGSAGKIRAGAKLRWTFPLNIAEIVWGDGEKTHRKIINMHSTKPFGEGRFEWSVAAPGWKWARIAVWDVAANGAFINPVRR